MFAALPKNLFINCAVLAAALLAGFACLPAAQAADTSAAYPPPYRHAAKAPPIAENAAPQTAAPMPARPYKGICGSFLVRLEAKNRFARQMRGEPGQPPLLIKKFTDIAETQYVRGAESYDIDRRYCTATVIMNNGQSYPATYVVARNQGFAAIGGLRVSFCVVGLDKWLVRDNDCRSLRAPARSVY